MPLRSLALLQACKHLAAPTMSTCLSPCHDFGSHATEAALCNKILATRYPRCRKPRKPVPLDCPLAVSFYAFALLIHVSKAGLCH